MYRTVLSAMCLAIASLAPAQALTFRVHTPTVAYKGQENVRVVIYLSSRSEQPRFGPDWFQPEPIFSLRFSGVKAGDILTVPVASSVHFPTDLKTIKDGDYYVQAVVDRNLGGRTIAQSPGNFYSDSTKVSVAVSRSSSIDLTCDHEVKAPTFPSPERVTQVHVQSKLLSAFYHRPTELKAAVIVPDEYAANSTLRFPTLYIVPGFGGGAGNPDEWQYMKAGTHRDGVPVVNVLLDPNCPTGHSVFADSANNGPWGKALTEELIPELEKQFRLVAKPAARLLNGHSSGGWSTLWLQTAYPTFFGGTWSTSPDPVDFRDFQMINLYKPNVNMFTDEAGKPRPLARFGLTPSIFYKQFSDMERPIRGEQLGSFDAVFSPLGKDGEPMPLWDRGTGKVDPVVANAWKKYDICLNLRTHWKELAPSLTGKIHVYCGNEDTFYLDGAVRLLKKEMAALGSDAVIEMFPGDHGSVMTPTLLQRIDREMGATLRKALPTLGQ